MLHFVTADYLQVRERVVLGGIQLQPPKSDE